MPRRRRGGGDHRGPALGVAVEAAPRRLLLALFRHGLSAVDPERLVRERVALTPGPPGVITVRVAGGRIRLPSPPMVVAAGKAAVGMARGLERIPLAGGVVITPHGQAGGDLPIPLEVKEAAHPVPDRRGVHATRQFLKRASSHTGPTLCLLSGGASSLLVCPRDGLTLSHKQVVTRLLLRSGAPIEELNTVRKHLSKVKGGGLLRVIRGRPIVTLALSDVVGDDLGTIGSGPAVADPTTFSDALAVLRRRGLLDAIPKPARDLLRRGALGEVADTVKPGDPEARGVYAGVIGSNARALDAIAREARRRGLRVVRQRKPLLGETRVAAVGWARRLTAIGRRWPRQSICVIAGGETTVTVRGRGLGGRNTEFALALAPEIAGTGWAVLSAGSDGIDGPTDAAGAFVDGGTLARAAAAGLNASKALERNDSYRFFAVLGDLFVTGPTGTNVMDIKIAIRC